MTIITFEELNGLKKGIIPSGISKRNIKAFKKFGYNKCLLCKEYFIKHRRQHFYCSIKCRVYHARIIASRERKQNERQRSDQSNKT